jgi:hypothetical protein
MTATVTTTRIAMYELVWSKPMTKAAQDFGISDVALKNGSSASIPQFAIMLTAAGLSTLSALAPLRDTNTQIDWVVTSN